uniref:Secreted protein n=1 Tax=Steinernema glaseri TaxID=37863 RepID=A0A1I7YL34_9BILA
MSLFHCLLVPFYPIALLAPFPTIVCRFTASRTHFPSFSHCTPSPSVPHGWSSATERASAGHPTPRPSKRKHSTNSANTQTNKRKFRLFATSSSPQSRSTAAAPHGPFKVCKTRKRLTFQVSIGSRLFSLPPDRVVAAAASRLVTLRRRVAAKTRGDINDRRQSRRRQPRALSVAKGHSSQNKAVNIPEPGGPRPTPLSEFQDQKFSLCTALIGRSLNLTSLRFVVLFMATSKTAHFHVPNGLLYICLSLPVLPLVCREWNHDANKRARVTLMNGRRKRRFPKRTANSGTCQGNMTLAPKLKPHGDCDQLQKWHRTPSSMIIKNLVELALNRAA